MSTHDHAEDEQHDLEVATVLATGLRNEFTHREILPRRHSTPGRYGVSPYRPSTILTNVARGNSTTVTPSQQYSPGIHQMAGQGELVLLQQMLEEHAVNLRDEQGMTPLMWASAYSQPQAAEMLILAGADIRLCSNDGHTALMLTAATGHEQLLNTLLAKNADINAISKSGDTALLYACHYGHCKCVKILLEWGADITATNQVGISAMETANRTNNRQILSVLRDHMISLLDPT